MVFQVHPGIRTPLFSKAWVLMFPGFREIISGARVFGSESREDQLLGLVGNHLTFGKVFGIFCHGWPPSYAVKIMLFLITEINSGY